MQTVRCPRFWLYANARAQQPGKDCERGSEEKEEVVEEEAEAKETNVKSVILLVCLPLGDSVDFCETDDYGSDSTQIQEAVLNLGD